jgi:hypothetical protein
VRARSASVAIAVVALFPAGPATVRATATRPVRAESDAARAADAFVWGYPLVVTERTLQSLARLAPVNRLTFQPSRSDATTRVVVAPNTDTLYAVAPLDLRGGPFALTLPAIRDRYYSFQLLSAYTDSFAYVGTRATHDRAGTWVIAPPGWHGRIPNGATRISSPTDQMLLLGRFLVADDADVANVHALGNNVKLQPLSELTGGAQQPAPPPIGQPAGTPQSVGDAGVGFYDELGDALAVNPPVEGQERRTLAGFAALGIGPGRHPSTEVQDPRVQAALAAGVQEGQRRITRAVSASKSVNGWVVNLHVGRYDHDALTRAAVAEVGWGANVPAEAIYASSSRDTGGAPYDGSRGYVIHFARRRLPPVKAFWSVTMYGPDRFFVENPINRYAIGDRTPGLQYGADGSLDIYVQHDAPTGHESNWLPAPAGPISLTLRLYLPKAAAIAGRYEYPTVRAT